MFRPIAVLLLGAFFLFSCNMQQQPANKAKSNEGPSLMLSDPQASDLAQGLFTKLHEISAEHVLLGHQDALAYGMGWKGGEFRSDINDALGDHPAVYGWDLGHLGDAFNIDTVDFAHMQAWAVAAHERGGINTYSWHMRNYAMGGSSWDTDSCVAACLPGGEVHELYLEKLDLAADFFSGLKTDKGELIPVIFRPFHEMTGGWFWWGKGNCSREDYLDLFRFTIDYLRKEKGMHQMLVAYSTDKFLQVDQYLEFYPGDDYVDVLAFDDYHYIRTKETSAQTLAMLECIDSLAQEKGKLTAISETGMETLPDPTWYTGVILPLLKSSEAARRISWILFWRNGRPDHYYAPYPGHPSVADFTEFMADPMMLSLSELPDFYAQ